MNQSLKTRENNQYSCALKAIGHTLDLWAALRTWIEGLLRCPRLDVVCLGSWPNTIMLALINRKASITTWEETNAHETTLPNGTLFLKRKFLSNGRPSLPFLWRSEWDRPPQRRLAPTGPRSSAACWCPRQTTNSRNQGDCGTTPPPSLVWWATRAKDNTHTLSGQPKGMDVYLQMYTTMKAIGEVFF